MAFFRTAVSRRATFTAANVSRLAASNWSHSARCRTSADQELRSGAPRTRPNPFWDQVCPCGRSGARSRAPATFLNPALRANPLQINDLIVQERSATGVPYDCGERFRVLPGGCFYNEAVQSHCAAAPVNRLLKWHRSSDDSVQIYIAHFHVRDASGVHSLSRPDSASQS